MTYVISQHGKRTEWLWVRLQLKPKKHISHNKNTNLNKNNINHNTKQPYIPIKTWEKNGK
jgi:hypothetical protein